LESAPKARITSGGRFHRRAARRDVEAATLAHDGPPPITHITLPTCRAHRVVRASRPGNAGRAKGPDFWCALEDGEVKVIGDEPANTEKDPDPSARAVS
jgi:hypothetical protein